MRSGHEETEEVDHVPFTTADAHLAGLVEEGVVVGTAGDELHVEDGVGTLEFDDVAETVGDVAGLTVAESGDLVLVGTAAPLVETLADGRSGDALRAIADLEVAAAGDASGVVTSWAEARNEDLDGSIAEYPVENLAECIPGDAGTVTVETQAAIRDGGELGRFLEGVVAVADAFENSTAGASGSG